MKKIILLAVILTWISIASAQTKDPQVESGLRQLARNTAKERAEIMQVFADFEKAFHALDLDGIMAIYDPDVLAYDIAPPLQYVGVKAYRVTWKNFLDAYDGPIDMELRGLSLTWSGDVAFTYTLERFTGKLKNGKPSEIWIRVTDCLVKKNGKWRIVHEHVSVPADFETGKAVLDLKP